MTIETEGEVGGSGLQTDPQAREIWDSIDEQESGGAPAATGNEPGTAADTATGAATTEPAPKADSEAAADPYADVPAHVRDEILGLKGTLQQLTSRLRNAEGHIGGLRTQLQRDLQTAAAAATKAGEQAPTQEQISTASKSPAALAKLVDEYPEFGSAIKEVVDAQAGEIAELRKALTTRQAQPDESVSRDELKNQLVDLTIRTKHSDWKQQVVDPAFDPWVATQPREVQALRNSDDPEDVIRLLDIRAAQTQAKRQVEQTHDTATARRRGNAVRAAVIPTGRSAASIASKDVDAMSPQELWAHLDAVELAK